MRFVKMHGTGNDFVMLGEKEAAGADLGSLAVKMCHRRFGVGADGLIAILPSDSAHFRMRIFNPDGSEPEMCGNGVRCAVRYFIENVAEKQIDIVNVDTLTGVRSVKVGEAGGVKGYTVEMGRPVFEPDRIPVKLDGERIVSRPIQLSDRPVAVTCVSMGNPHAVIFYDGEIPDGEVEKIGPEIENHELFPARTNVEFIKVIRDGELLMRVWERGAGVTLACGTGACASLAAAHINGLCGRKALVHLPGGDLFIEWTGAGTIEMTGPAENVFTGDWLG